jgi:hypothetical protein
MRQVFGRKDADELLIGCVDPHIPVLRRALRFWRGKNLSTLKSTQDLSDAVIARYSTSN